VNVKEELEEEVFKVRSGPKIAPEMKGFKIRINAKITKYVFF